jgi:hypothetical protein
LTGIKDFIDTHACSTICKNTKLASKKDLYATLEQYEGRDNEPEDLMIETEAPDNIGLGGDEGSGGGSGDES